MPGVPFKELFAFSQIVASHSLVTSSAFINLLESLELNAHLSATWIIQCFYDLPGSPLIDYHIPRKYGKSPWDLKTRTYHSHRIVEQRFSENNDEEDFVDVDFLEHCQHGNRIHCGNQAAEQEEVQQSAVEFTYESKATLL